MRHLLHPALRRLNEGSGTSHASPEMMAAFSEGNLTADVREAFLVHLAACQACRQQLSVQSKAVPSIWRTRIVQYSGVLAASLCVVVVLWLARLFPGAAPAAPKPPAPPSTQASAELVQPVTPRPNSALLRQPAQVDWRFSGSRNHRSLERSRDGGKTWSAANLNQNFQVDLLVWNGTHTWIRNLDGRTFESHDAGVHWTLSVPAVKMEQAEALTKSIDLDRTIGSLKLITRTGGRWVKTDGTWHREKASPAPRSLVR